jgi:hypothetical protein
MGSQPANPASPVKTCVARWTVFRFCQRRRASIAGLLNRCNVLPKDNAMKTPHGDGVV